MLIISCYLYHVNYKSIFFNVTDCEVKLRANLHMTSLWYLHGLGLLPSWASSWIQITPCTSHSPWVIHSFSKHFLNPYYVPGTFCRHILLSSNISRLVESGKRTSLGTGPWRSWPTSSSWAWKERLQSSKEQRVPTDMRCFMSFYCNWWLTRHMPLNILPPSVAYATAEHIHEPCGLLKNSRNSPQDSGAEECRRCQVLP